MSQEVAWGNGVVQGEGQSVSSRVEPFDPARDESSGPAREALTLASTVAKGNSLKAPQNNPTRPVAARVIEGLDVIVGQSLKQSCGMDRGENTSDWTIYVSTSKTEQYTQKEKLMRPHIRIKQVQKYSYRK